MKNNIKFLFLISVLASLTACNKPSNKINVHEIKEYFFETDTYKSLDYKFANDYFAGVYDNWHGGCSAISANINGEQLVGRNMDLNISNKCAYFVKTSVNDKYKTIGLSYTFRDISPEYSIVKDKGIEDDFAKILPFMCDDVINEKGLHVELNMRHGEKDKDGNDLFSTEYINKNAKERFYVFELAQYMALNCADLSEAKEYVKNTIDVYSQNTYWNYCFLVTDAAGNSNLLEFGKNAYNWVDKNSNGVVGQTNFYVTPEWNAKEDIKTGEGRYNTLMSDISGVNSKTGLFNLMKKISYSWFYSGYDSCKNNHFDPRSEIVGEKNELGLDLTYDFVMSSENEPKIKLILDALGAQFNGLSRQEQQNLNTYWESTFTMVINPKEKKFEARLFENENYLFELSFDGVKPLSSI